MERRSFLLGAGAQLVGGGPSLGGSDLTSLSGDRFKSGQEEYLLADIMAPPLYTLSAETPPFFAEAQSILSETLSAGVSKISDVIPPTKWGVRQVHLVRNDGTFVQEELVRRGAVWVAPRSDNDVLCSRLIKLELEARLARRGIWAYDEYSVLKPETASRGLGNYRLIEGTVTKATQTRRRFYMNFGEDYRTDFTASIQGRLHRKWREAELLKNAVSGVLVRVRGFLVAINGPSIEVSHYRQIEFLTKPGS